MLKHWEAKGLYCCTVLMRWGFNSEKSSQEEECFNSQGFPQLFNVFFSSSITAFYAFHYGLFFSSDRKSSSCWGFMSKCNICRALYIHLEREEHRASKCHSLPWKLMWWRYHEISLTVFDGIFASAWKFYDRISYLLIILQKNFPWTLERKFKGLVFINLYHLCY